MGSLKENLPKGQERREREEDSRREERKGEGGGELWDLRSMKHLQCLLTLSAVLTLAPACPFLTTLEWPLEDAVISAVSPICEEVQGRNVLKGRNHEHCIYTTSLLLCV